jgi:hypothetical protein
MDKKAVIYKYVLQPGVNTVDIPSHKIKPLNAGTQADKDGNPEVVLWVQLVDRCEYNVPYTFYAVATGEDFKIRLDQDAYVDTVFVPHKWFRNGLVWHIYSRGVF